MGASRQDAELTRALMEMHREVRAVLGAVARRSELTSQQIEMLCVLEHRVPSFRELAELFGCDKTNITGMADRLAGRGLVTREPDLEDRRVTRLRLTDEGAAFSARLKDAVAAEIDRRWSHLTAEDRTRLATLAAPAEPNLSSRPTGR